MLYPHNLRSHTFEAWLPCAVLLLLLALAYVSFFLFPYAGFDISADHIVYISPPDRRGDHLQIGDRLIQIGPLLWDDFQKNPWQTVFQGTAAGDRIPLRIEREGEIIRVDWVYRGATPDQVIQHLMELWWLGFVFWFAGTCVILFIRPRDTIWKLLISFYYLTAIWLLAGSGPSRWHVLGGAIILRVAAWMFAPVSLQLNWYFPRSLARLPAWFWWALYVLAAGLCVLEFFSVLPEPAFLTGLAIGGAGIVLLPLAHVIFQPGYRKYIAPLAIGAGVAVLPPLLVVLRDLFYFPSSPANPGFSGGLGQGLFTYTASMLGIAALPGIYFYSVYMLQAGEPNRRVKRMVRIYLVFILISAILVLSFEFLFIELDTTFSLTSIGILLFCLCALISAIGLFPIMALPALQSTRVDDFPGVHPRLRANRLVTLYLYFVLVLVIGGALIFLLSASQDLPFTVGWIALAISALIAMFTIFIYPRFQRFVDCRILGIPLPPTHLLESYSSRIITSLELSSLVGLLRNELLPSLLVRQSALYQTSNGRFQLLYCAGLSETRLFSNAELPGLLRACEETAIGGPLPAGGGLPAWVRVLLPLRVDTRLVGVWLLGGRDPDDSYDPGEMGVLQSIANQTAIALVNIQQSERLHALYQADIEREEAKRAALALFLHDEVLNPLAALSMQVEPGAASPKLEHGFQSLISNLREAVGGLRPAMLSYGLYPALVELVDELSERVGECRQVSLEMEPLTLRYDAKAEQHLYRIVEQACENALRHSACRNLVVSGLLAQDWVELVVRDDGTGLPEDLALNLGQLLAKGHYGLVGMYERAALVGAELLIDSSHGVGTCVRLVWSSDQYTAQLLQSGSFPHNWGHSSHLQTSRFLHLEF